MSELDLDFIEAQVAEWQNPDSRTPLSTIAMVAVNNMPALIAALREAETQLSVLQGDVREAIDYCTKYGDQHTNPEALASAIEDILT